jgi:hypothetical protein
MRAEWSLGAVVLGLGALVGTAGPASAKSAVSCSGVVLAGGAELLCSHVAPTEPAQFCTYSWALSLPTNQIQVVNGSFLVPTGSTNVQEYEASGFARAASEPIVICQGKRKAP